VLRPPPGWPTRAVSSAREAMVPMGQFGRGPRRHNRAHRFRRATRLELLAPSGLLPLRALAHPRPHAPAQIKPRIRPECIPQTTRLAADRRPQAANGRQATPKERAAEFAPAHRLVCARAGRATRGISRPGNTKEARGHSCCPAPSVWPAVRRL
jgi:hypothetical protein